LQHDINHAVGQHVQFAFTPSLLVAMAARTAETAMEKEKALTAAQVGNTSSSSSSTSKDNDAEKSGRSSLDGEAATEQDDATKYPTGLKLVLIS
jgi:hypothetical protein